MNQPALKEKEIKDLYLTNSTTEIAKILNCSDETVRKYLRFYGIPVRSRAAGFRLAMDKKPKIESIYIEKKGYHWKVQRNHPYCNSHGCVALHRLIIENTIGRYLTKKEVVHHIDGNPHNNNLDNLLLCSDSKHVSLHRKINPHPQDERGRFYAAKN